MLEKYLDRIGYDGTRELTRENLFRLQYCHLHTIPYENFDIRRDVEFDLEIEHVLDKIVKRRRGGYCFELNGAFTWLLRSFGYDVTEYFGRFLRNKEHDIPMRRHRVLRVELPEGSYICDVGVGGSCPTYPLKLIESIPQDSGDTEYRFRRDDIFGWVIEEKTSRGWEDYYCFTEEKQYDIDFVSVDYYCQRHPNSFFRQSDMACIKTEDGRFTISGDEFKIFSGDSVYTEIMETEERKAEVRKIYFGIEF
ncbi:MAG: arylamine N-acetyltransferase [Clostridiales bacterium]|nr:arylamine N-acetyltransferase [Clostridiales bacterium]